MSNFSDSIQKYIKTEKDISKYKISLLKKSKNISLAKKRLLNIEREFLELPLEMMDFEDVADVAAAISIYRDSRDLFYKTYNVSPPSLANINKGDFLNTLNDKVTFIKRIGEELSNIRIQELNVVQNDDLYYDLVKRQALKNSTSIELEKRQLELLDLEQLNKLEPSTLAKKRARIQAVYYSIGRYLTESIKAINIDSKSSIENLKIINDSIDNIIYNLKRNVYRYYNEAIIILPHVLKNTMGKNNYIGKIHTLLNILNFDELNKFGVSPYPISNSKEFKTTIPVLGNIFYGIKKAISNDVEVDSEKNIQNKVFGILLPIPRKGNEKMTMLYKNICIGNENVSHTFSDGISNIRATSNKKEAYYKAILMFPLWKLIDVASKDDATRNILSTLLSFNKNNFETINFKNKDIVTYINKISDMFINIDSTSKVLVPRTRSEEEGLNDIYSFVNSKIAEINQDYGQYVVRINDIMSA